MDDPTKATRSGEGDKEPTVENLQEELRQKEQDIQFLKGRWGEKNAQQEKELQDLRTQVSELGGRVNEQRELFDRSKATETTVDPFELSEDQMDEIRDDPTKVIDLIRNTQSSTLSAVLNALKERDNAFGGRFDELSNTVQSRFKELDPELQQWRQPIDELRQDEALKDLPDETLIAVAKRMDMEPAMEYRGAAGGQRQHSDSKPKPREFNPDADDMATRIAIQLANGNMEHAKKLWEDAESRRTA